MCTLTFTGEFSTKPFFATSSQRARQAAWQCRGTAALPLAMGRLWPHRWTDISLGQWDNLQLSFLLRSVGRVVSCFERSAA